MTKIDINEISDYDIYAFSQTLNLKDRKKINSVFNSSDKFDSKTGQGKDILETNKELLDFSTGIGEDLFNHFKEFLSKKKAANEILNTINDSGKYNEEKYSKAIDSITEDNVLEVFGQGCDIGSHSACFGAGDKLITWRSEDKIRQDLNHVRKVLQNLCAQNGIDTSNFDKEDFKSSSENGYLNLDSDNLLDKYIKALNDKNYLTNVINPLLNTDNSKKLENAIEKRYTSAIKNNEDLEQPQDGNYDTGNGRIDKISTQQGDNCWICAGLNSLASTPTGKAFLEKNIKRDNSRHLTAIHLQDAENENLPSPDGDGIYVFSDKEIAQAQKTLSSGDGDFTAYNLAIYTYRNQTDKYTFDETDGSLIQATYEILTGLKNNENFGDTGISTIPKDYKTIYSIIKSGKGAGCFSDVNHGYNISGVDNSGNLLIQESNQAPDWERNKRFEYIKDSNPPTYILTNENKEKYFNGCAIFQWAQ